MHRRTLLLGIFAAAIATGGAWETLSYARLKLDLQHATDLATREAAEANRHVAELRAQLATARSRRVAAMPPGGAGERPPSSDVESSVVAGATFSPEQRAGYLRQVDRTHAAFFVRAGLTPEQIDRFNALYAEHEAWQRDYFTALREQHLTAASAGAIELKEQEDQRLATALREALGPDTAQKLRDFEATAPTREVVDAIAANLSLSDTPLTLPQAKQLQQLLQSSEIIAHRETPAAWEPVLAQAATFLQSRQMEELRAQMRAAQARSVTRQLEDLIARSSSPAK